MNTLSKFTSNDRPSGHLPLLSKSTPLAQMPPRTERDNRTESPSLVLSSEPVFVIRDDAYFYFDEI
jgi:hypothetical protein